VASSKATRIYIEFSRKGAQIGVIDGKSDSFLQSSCKCLGGFQFGADKGIMRRLLRDVSFSNE
jgi:hypothetical protein